MSLSLQDTVLGASQPTFLPRSPEPGARELEPVARELQALWEQLQEAVEARRAAWEARVRPWGAGPGCSGLGVPPWGLHCLIWKPEGAGEAPPLPHPSHPVGGPSLLRRQFCCCPPLLPPTPCDLFNLLVALWAPQPRPGAPPPPHQQGRVSTWLCGSDQRCSVSFF